MSTSKRAILAVPAVSLAALALMSGNAAAQQAGPAAGPLEEVVVVGTRRRDRSVAGGRVHVQVDARTRSGPGDRPSGAGNGHRL